MNDVKEAFDTLANIAGGVIKNKEFVEIETTKIVKRMIEHDLKNFYCVAVPGKAFFIRSGGKISVTGNTLHSESMIKLFRTYIEENREIWNDELKGKIYTIATKMVELEDKFIDLAFGMVRVADLDAADVKSYIRYITDRRLISLGLKGIMKVKKNPLPWVEEMLNAPTHTNFFENRVTDYAKGSLSGDWKDVWAKAA
jgi:ribonucleotide reductase beta subunit family protein with ferritin-like domain